MAVQDDAGFALILVIGFMTIILGIVAVSLSVANRSLNSSSAHTNYDRALAVAESGVDQTLGTLKVNQDFANASTSTSCSGLAYSLSTERAWARCTIAAAATIATVTHTVNGDFYAMRPAGLQTVYSMGWVPSITTAHPKKRLIKTDYIYADYVPSQALLVGGNLDMSGSVAISGATGQPSGVHSNGNITSGASDRIDGPVTASGTYDCAAHDTNATPCLTTGNNTAVQPIPDIDPLFSYHNQVPVYGGNADGLADPTLYNGTWWDLCPDGTVHAPAAGTAAIPCSGTMLDSSGSYRGWTWTAGTSTTPPQWRMTQDDSPYAGAYYVWRGNAYIDGKTGHGHTWNATVFAEAGQPTAIAPYSSAGVPGGYTNTATCGKYGGDIAWNHTDVDDYIPGTVFVAGADLIDSANNNAGAGIFAAADQVHMSTSSASLTGAIVAGDACKGDPSSPDTNQVQGITLTYDDTGEGAVASVVRTTLWLEYVG
jgi:hypothetical protein